MGTGYTRNDTVNNIADGNVINASDLDGEFDAVQSAFDAATGHTHDGTTGEGAPIEVTGPAQEYVSTATELRPKTNNTYDLGSASLQWKDLYVDGTANLDTVDIDAGNIDGTTIGGTTPAAGTFTTLTATGNVTLGDAATDTVTITADVASNIIPSADNTYDLGASGSEWKDLYIDGTANIDSLVADTADINGGTIDGTVIGGSTPAAISGTTGTFSGNLTVDTDTLFVDAANNRVGVGTSSPERQVTINSSFPVLQLTNPTTGTTSNDGLLIFQSGLDAYFSNQEAGPTIFETNNTERMRITSTGSVGIGTSSPTEKLDVSGANAQSIRVTSTNGDLANLVMNSTGNASWSLSSDTVMRFKKDSTEYMRIDASGNVGIGTSSPASYPVAPNLVVDAGTSGGITIRSGSSNYGGIFFADGTTGAEQYRGWVQYNHNHAGAVDALLFGTASTERMRIDASGNLLVGKTSYGSVTGTGSQMGASGVAIFTASSDAPLYLNRTTSDGSIVNFYKDGTTVGSIGTFGGRIVFADSPSGVTIDDAANTFRTINASNGGARDGATDLGDASNRWKSLYLSGGVYLGGTGAANLLDDYEEGTWTPVVFYTGTNTPTYTAQSGRYTKIGRMVQLQIYLNWDENGSTGNIEVRTLPFTTVNSASRAVPSIFSFGLTGLTENVSVSGVAISNDTRILLYLNNNSATPLSATYTDNDQDLYVTITYEAA